jgi:hypothetical protein
MATDLWGDDVADEGDVDRDEVVTLGNAEMLVRW